MEGQLFFVLCLRAAQPPRRRRQRQVQRGGDLRVAHDSGCHFSMSKKFLCREDRFGSEDTHKNT